ncbi:hypothetical protein PR202_gb18734 [Eleusine coracana subsp. coracana]|uniref:MO25-like protein n=1 Tax=Eleusine coracana subsp. coracana TaxID=191504 RepID=A0AAV5F642_ELECO|nr:hypothetical protein PR202_gb18734 [Eleusine coracana subsp. coracana]
MMGCLWPCATAVLSRSSSQRGLFRSKPRTPPEVVQHVRELLAYVKDHREGCGGGKHYSKREHKELTTRHKSTASVFFSENYDWFFAEFNSKLLSSSNYIIRRQAIQLLGDILLERSNAEVMVRYVSTKEHLMILMNLLREQSKAVQVEAFHVFKLFVANKKRPPEINGILRANRKKLLRFLGDFTLDKEDKKFEADKAKVVSDILALAMES